MLEANSKGVLSGALRKKKLFGLGATYLTYCLQTPVYVYLSSLLFLETCITGFVELFLLVYLNNKGSSFQITQLMSS